MRAITFAFAVALAGCAATSDPGLTVHRDVGSALAEIRLLDKVVLGAAFSADNRRILTWSANGTARLWDAATGAQIGPNLQHPGDYAVVSGALFSADGSRILSWGSDRAARLWDAASGAQIGPQMRHEGGVVGAVFSADESRILTWGSEGSARLWNSATGAQIGPTMRNETGNFSANDAAVAAQLGIPLGPERWISVEGARFSADESRILTWSQDGSVRLWNTATGAQVGPAIGQGQNLNVGAVFSADESRILTWGGEVRLWSAATGEQIGPALRTDGALGFGGALFSADESRILTWSSDGTLRIWDAATGAQIGPAMQHTDTPARRGFQFNPPPQFNMVIGAAFSADESRILSWSHDATARLWDAATGAQIGPALRHEEGSWVKGALFSVDESRILTWSRDGTARLWSTATGARIGSSMQHEGEVVGAAFSADESRILTWSSDGTARLWNAATGVPIGPPMRHETRGCLENPQLC